MTSHIGFSETDTGEVVFHWPSDDELPAFWNHFLFYSGKWSFAASQKRIS